MTSIPLLSYATRICRVSTTRRAPCWTEDTAVTGTGNPVRGIVDSMPLDTSNDQGGEGKGQRTEQGVQIFCFLF